MVQIQGNTVICRDDGSELSVLSTGRESTGTGKVTQEEHETEGVGRGASRPSPEGICWLESKAGKSNKEGEWEQEGRLGDELQSRKGGKFNCNLGAVLISVPFVLMNIS